MTEKRFTIAQSNTETTYHHGIKDNLNDVVFNYGVRNDFLEDICDLLNKQHEEIIELREAMKRLMADMMVRR